MSIQDNQGRGTQRSESSEASNRNSSRLLQEFDSMPLGAQDSLLKEMVRRHAVNMQRQSTNSIVEVFQKSLQDTLGIEAEEEIVYGMPKPASHGKRRGRPRGSTNKQNSQGRQQTRARKHPIRTRPGVFEGGTTWQDVIEGIVQRHPEGLHVDEITSEVKQSANLPSGSRDVKAVIRNNLSKMNKARRVRKLGRGRYAPVGAGSASNGGNQ